MARINYYLIPFFKKKRIKNKLKELGYHVQRSGCKEIYQSQNILISLEKSVATVVCPNSFQEDTITKLLNLR